MRSTHWLSLALVLSSATAFALPPNADPALRPGANHHTGDDGFVADLGRAPTSGEEALRMHEHFIAVRARLAAQPATKPELEATRQKLLAALDTYIAKGTTPDNDALPWRTPVFIDGKGTICAVGFLIQESAGRALAEKVAATHRYSFIEDIAKDMPEVRDWVAQSGFTLDELGQIQPGYEGPDVLMFHPFELAKSKDIPDGAYDQNGVTGTFAHRKMTGAWKVVDKDGAPTGSGDFHNGNGAWTSFFADGKVMAKGDFAHNRPSGAWKFFHESGALAAEGSFERGQRVGKWHFYYDNAGKLPIAVGSFAQNGYVEGTWKHYDAKGELLATSTRDTIPRAWQKEKQLFWVSAYRIDIAPTIEGITHRIHQGSMSGDSHRLDELATADGKEHVFMNYDAKIMYDEHGHKLEQTDGGWRSDDCGWSSARKHAAADGDLPQLHGLIYTAAEEVCKPGKLVGKARAARLTKLAAAIEPARAMDPQLVTELALGDDAKTMGLPDILAANMTLDITWPHVDGRFIDVYKTLPGYSRGY
jgi:hypothetical protein